MYTRSRVERKSALLIYSYVLFYIIVWRCLECKEEDECDAVLNKTTSYHKRP